MSRHSKTKVKVVSVDYKRNKDVTICQMIIDPQLHKSALALVSNDKYVSPLIKKYVLSNAEGKPFLKITQKTKCHDTDEFNVVTGQRIAESKCKAKAFRIMNKIYTGITKRYSTVLNIYSDLRKNCDYAYCTELKHIKELQK
jgi:hypothetical protein